MNEFSSCFYLKKNQRIQTPQTLFLKNRKNQESFFSDLYVEKQGFVFQTVLFETFKKEKNFKKFQILHSFFKKKYAQSYFLSQFASKTYLKDFIFCKFKRCVSFFFNVEFLKKDPKYLNFFPRLNLFSSFFQNLQQNDCFPKVQFFEFQKDFFFQKLNIYEYFFNFFQKKKNFQDFDSIFSHFFLEVLFFSFSNFKNIQPFEKKDCFLQCLTSNNTVLKKKRTILSANFFSLKKNGVLIEMKEQKQLCTEFLLNQRQKFFVQFFKVVFSFFQFSFQNFLSLKTKKNLQIEKRSHLFLKTSISLEQSLSFQNNVLKALFLGFLTFSKNFLFLIFYYPISSSFFLNSKNLDLVYHQSEKFPKLNWRVKIEQHTNSFFETLSFWKNFYMWNIFTENKKNFLENDNIHLFLDFEKSFFLTHCHNKKIEVDFLDFSSIFQNMFLEKTFFHISAICQLQNLKECFLKNNFIPVLSFFSFFNEFRNNSCVHPICLLFANYGNNVFLSNSFFSVFLKNQKFFEEYSKLFSDLRKFQNFVFSKFSFFDLFVQKQIEFCSGIAFRSFLRLFKNIHKNLPNRNLLKFLHIFWNVSKQCSFLKTFVGTMPLYSISPFFANFLMYNTENWKIQEFACYRRNTWNFDWNEFSISIFCWYEKNLKRKLLFEKTPTFHEVNRHLKECKELLQSSRGKNQFSFMKKLQKKIRVWLQKYSSVGENSVPQKQIFSYCDSMLFKYLWNWAKKTHPKKSKLWIRKKYFHFLSKEKLFFGYKLRNHLICLPLHTQF